MKRECESKQKLLEKAMELIWESSYGSVSVDDICAKSGVNKRSFYYFYKSKSDLTAAAMERHWEQQRSIMDAIFSAATPALEQLDRYCQAIIDDQRKQYETFGKVLGLSILLDWQRA
jgi:TetR/AcrR family transcriptional regulator, transcriptional repressor for nem operon